MINIISKYQDTVLNETIAWHNIEKAYMIESTTILMESGDEGEKAEKSSGKIKTIANSIKEWFIKVGKAIAKFFKDMGSTISSKVKEISEKIKAKFSKGDVKDAPTVEIEVATGVKEDGTVETSKKKFKINKAFFSEMLNKIKEFFNRFKKASKETESAAKEGEKAAGSAAASGSSDSLKSAEEKKAKVTIKQRLSRAWAQVCMKFFSAISKGLAAIASGQSKMADKIGNGKDGVRDKVAGSLNKSSYKNTEKSYKAGDKSDSYKTESVSAFLENLEYELMLEKTAKKYDSVEEEEIDEDSEVYDEAFDFMTEDCDLCDDEDDDDLEFDL